jgi:hypothetical protein
LSISWPLPFQSRINCIIGAVGKLFLLIKQIPKDINFFRDQSHLKEREKKVE